LNVTAKFAAAARAEKRPKSSWRASRDREIRRRRARREKTKKLLARIKTTTDNKLKARLTEKLKRINPNLKGL